MEYSEDGDVGDSRTHSVIELLDDSRFMFSVYAPSHPPILCSAQEGEKMKVAHLGRRFLCSTDEDDWMSSLFQISGGANASELQLFLQHAPFKMVIFLH